MNGWLIGETSENAGSKRKETRDDDEAEEKREEEERRGEIREIIEHLTICSIWIMKRESPI